MDNIPEIRIRKGSDAPSLGEQDRSGAPLASFELSDLESESDCGGEGVTQTLKGATHDESIDSGVGAGETSDVNGAASSMEMDVTEAEEVFNPPTPKATSPDMFNNSGHNDHIANSSSDDGNHEVEEDDDKESDDDDDDGLPGDQTPTEEQTRADAFGYAQFDDESGEPANDDDSDSDDNMTEAMKKAINSGMLNDADFEVSAYDKPITESSKPTPPKDGPARPPPPKRPPPPSSKAAPPRPKPPRPVSPCVTKEDKEVVAINTAAPPAKIKITLPKHEMKKHRSKSPRKPPGPRPPPPKIIPTVQTPKTWQTFGDEDEKHDETEALSEYTIGKNRCGHT